MKRIAVLLFIGFFALTVSPAAQTDPIGPKQLTIRVFSTQSIRKIAITPLGSGNWLRTCSSCKQRPITSPLHIELNENQLRYDHSASSKELELHGSFRFAPDNIAEAATAAGIWKITPKAARLQVLLTIPSERYIMAVLSGEAAPDEPFESLKAMAVTMRTFAIVNANRHLDEGFGLCDSTHCQVSRYGKIRPEIERAVKETAGEMLWSSSQLAKINFTENCGGMAEDAGNVWSGGDHLPYLHAHPDPYCLRRTSSEWHAQIPLEQISSVIKREGWNAPEHLDSLRVIKRSPTGRAMLIELEGEGTHASVAASSFRFAVDRALGWNQIRSDWYTVGLNSGLLHFDGKGYGHGVGLCQAGAYEMALEGKSYRDILHFYFPGTEIRITPKDGGWKLVQGTGWTLFTTDGSSKEIAQGNTAWTKARALFPPRTQVRPTVHAMPTTELFRQTTEEPGWVLASTRGSDIFLQPSSVFQKNAPKDETLLHEFLHVLVEQEAAQQTPLWLREGLVEALTETSSKARSPRIDPDQIDALLAHPTDLAASRRAHVVAGAFVHALIQRYGVMTVRGWLKSGVPAAAMKPAS